VQSKRIPVEKDKLVRHIERVTDVFGAMRESWQMLREENRCLVALLQIEGSKRRDSESLVWLRKVIDATRIKSMEIRKQIKQLEKEVSQQYCHQYNI
jgi:hypothetical protein